MWMILDGLVLCVILIFIFLSAHRGFVRTLVELIGFVLALHISLTVGGLVSESVYEHWVQPKATTAIVDIVEEIPLRRTDELVNSVWESLPNSATQLAENFGITPDSVLKRNDFSSAQTATQTAEELCQAVLYKPVVTVVQSACSLLLFLVLMFLVRWIAKLVNKVCRIPIIGGVNHFLGGVLGLLKGTVIAGALCLAITTVVSFTENGFLIFTPKNIEASVLFRFLSELYLYF